MTEMSNYSLKLEDSEVVEKLLDALPVKWEMYALMIRESEKYETFDLEEVISR